HAYDSDPANGLEIDIYEHELAADRSSNDPKDVRANEILLMKCIGGATNPPSTKNELRDDGETAIHIPSINEGWHKIGLLWTPEKLIWFVDGVAKVQDTRLVPEVDMFLILSREANTGASQSANPADHLLRADGARIPSDSGLWGRNVATPANLDLIRDGRDEVLTRSVRAWKIEKRVSN
ncbi:MAG: glycoside hydrolase family 16 protein, partial [Rubripirellula sp.]